MEQGEERVPLFGKWANWYWVVIVLHILGIIIYYWITGTFTP